jgi:ATP phosphoribosyltransferase regulatory subunit
MTKARRRGILRLAMSEFFHPALLPTGLYDLLPPEAENEAAAVAQMMATLAAHGYRRVKPPLVEFEETLLSGAGAAMAPLTFRMMDPVSHRMVGLRADMTPQVARIAATRLGHMPRPLRLSYAGQVLLVKGSEIRPDRQIGQVGAELIGAASAAADVEAITVAAEALAAAGVSLLSVDLTLPTLVPAVAESYGLAGHRAAVLRAALDRKDSAAVAAVAGEAGPILRQLLAAAGPAAAALAALDRLELPQRARAERERLAAVHDGLAAAMPDLQVTIDPVENRGFEYQTGLSFSFFAGNMPGLGELGRGGRYEAGDPAKPEPATGFTLYTDMVLHTLPQREGPRRILVPFGGDPARARALRAAGWIAVAALEPAADWRAEARRLGCSHILEGEIPVALDLGVPARARVRS